LPLQERPQWWQLAVPRVPLLPALLLQELLAARRNRPLVSPQEQRQPQHSSACGLFSSGQQEEAVHQAPKPAQLPSWQRVHGAAAEAAEAVPAGNKASGT